MQAVLIVEIIIFGALFIGFDAVVKAGSFTVEVLSSMWADLLVALAHGPKL